MTEENHRVVSVSRSGVHEFSKQTTDAIRLLAGLGVEGDAHMGETVKHRSRVAEDPTEPNLRQVHLIQQELFDELALSGFSVKPGDLGENITTQGIDLLGLCAGARLEFPGGAVIELTGLRNPCAQIDHFQTGLLRAVLGRDEAGKGVLKAGAMGIVIAGGEVRPGDRISVIWPAGERRPLGRV